MKAEESRTGRSRERPNESSTSGKEPRKAEDSRGAEKSRTSSLLAGRSREKPSV